MMPKKKPSGYVAGLEINEAFAFACVAWFHARVENADHGVSRWVGLMDVAVPVGVAAGQREAMLAAGHSDWVTP